MGTSCSPDNVERLPATSSWSTDQSRTGARCPVPPVWRRCRIARTDVVVETRPTSRSAARPRTLSRCDGAVRQSRSPSRAQPQHTSGPVHPNGCHREDERHPRSKHHEPQKHRTVQQASGPRVATVRFGNLPACLPRVVDRNRKKQPQPDRSQERPKERLAGRRWFRWRQRARNHVGKGVRRIPVAI